MRRLLYALDGSKKKMQVFFFSFRRLSIFLRDGLRDAREAERAGILWGKKLGGWDLWVGETSHYLLGTKCV